MSDVAAETRYVQVVLHNDYDDGRGTPEEFVVELLHSVFGTPLTEAHKYTAMAARYGQAICGAYPDDKAAALLERAQQRIRAAGHPLVIKSKAVGTADDMHVGPCKLCRAPFGRARSAWQGLAAVVCDDCSLEVANNLPELTHHKPFDTACEALDWHFAGVAADKLVATSRQFPGHMRADVQGAIDRLFGSPVRFLGIHEKYRYETLTFAALSRHGRDALAIAAAQYHDVDIGGDATVKCLHNGLWLCQADGLRYAVLLSAY
jgi:ATP-dependent Clp protease adapter protein ClpS